MDYYVHPIKNAQHSLHLLKGVHYTHASSVKAAGYGSPPVDNTKLSEEIMTFKIFVSHTSIDKNIAHEVARVINNAFGGDIELFVAFQEIRGGDKWKEVIKNNLNDCDAILCIVTKEYVHKPWLFIEWSAFWLADKKYYVLLTEDVIVDELIHPMQDRQVTQINNDPSVRMFFRALASDSRHETVPYSYVQEFIDTTKDAIILRDKEKAEKSFAKYQDDLNDLPNSDAQKIEIADYLYQSRNFINYQKVIDSIRDESVKLNLALQLVERGDFENLSEIVSKIINADNLTTISLALIDLNYHDEKVLKQIIENLSTKNQAELRKISTHIAGRNEDSGNLFAFIIGHLNNIAELRKVVSYFLENGKSESPTTAKLVKNIGARNLAELRKVGTLMIDNGLQDTPLFLETFKILCGNQREAEKLLTELYQVDSHLFQKLLDSNFIVNQRSLARLKQLTEQ